MESVRSARAYGFDVFRCIALAIVLAEHAYLGLFLGLGFAAWDRTGLFWTLVSMISIDWFFVLSGCLIGAMMIRGFEAHGGWWAGARAFWVRRWFRTIPNYVLFLLVNLGLVAWGVAPGPGHWQHAVFAQNLFGDEVGWFFIESWSLAVEEWFYVLAPLVLGVGVLATRARGRGAFVLAVALLVVVPPALRWGMGPPADLAAWDQGVRRAVLLHMDVPGWGVLAAVTSRWAPRLWSWAPRAKFGLGVAATALSLGMVLQMGFGGPLAAVPRLANALGFTFAGLGVYLALPWLATLRAPSPAWGRAFASGTDWSYSIYLVHLPLIYVLRYLLPPQTLPAVVSMTVAWAVLSVLLSAGIFTWFERPIARLRERLAPKVDAMPFAMPPKPVLEAAPAGRPVVEA